ncbi:MAG: ABC-type transport system involved in Fe-S cluster assembly fused permease/ATPase subunit [Colwellia sp.]|jgi:ABC-type transport system involved in Fe-S cluster assembly fused permease/ATPase subunit
MVITILFVKYGMWCALVILSLIIIYIAYSIFATALRTHNVCATNKADLSSNSHAIDSVLNYRTVNSMLLIQLLKIEKCRYNRLSS